MILYWVLSILALGLLVIIHEAGHFFVARACGMKVESFSVGFGPRLLSIKGKKTEYMLSALPLGGYVRIAGMAPGDGTPEDAPDSFMSKPAWQRFLVIFAGPFINWLFAFVLLVGLFIVGVHSISHEPVVGLVMDNTAAAAAGLQPNDRIEAIDGKAISGWEDMTDAIVAHKAKPMQLLIKRGPSELTLTATPSAQGKLGIAPSTVFQRYSFGEAIPMAALETGRILESSLTGIRMLFQGHHEQLSGPVGIVTQTAEAAKASPLNLFGILVQISLALAFMNLLPIPALDGGRLIFILIAMIRRKPVNQRVEAVVHGVGMILLLGLMAWVTFGDIGKLGHPHLSAPTKAEQQHEAGPGK